MDEYKKSIIEFVRGHPIIWDSTNKDYKNRDQRKQLWEDIDSQVKPPAGSNTHAKDTWENMTRSFSNALKRKDKRSGSRAGNDKEWKFEKDMMFLLPVKQLRYTSGYKPETSEQTNFDDCQDNPQSQTYTGVDNTPDGDNNHLENLPDAGRQKFEKAHKKKKRKQACTDNEDTNYLIKLVKQRQVEKLDDSPRLNFFRSMMPIIDSFDDDQFMNLQMDFIQAVQRQKHVRRFPHTYEYPAQSDSSADS
ncbi:uncharacterized protein LOC101859160 [Aplysia californica]|uniref:Uncharacterized protein LOC101859160 n=1 Tax=Aplysia californica TaxID=6500 RepID=A0ABM0JJ42_APLCA|nr:uncharacterized protein LOC101859160 [Aplysia californica]